MSKRENRALNTNRDKMEANNISALDIHQTQTGECISLVAQVYEEASASSPENATRKKERKKEAKSSRTAKNGGWHPQITKRLMGNRA